MEEIKAGGYSKVVLSLDNDATYEAIKLQMKWRKEIKGLVVAGLGCDIKDMGQDDFETYLLENVL